MDYNSTFLGLIVAGVVLVVIGFGLVLTQPALRPASAVMAIETPAREARLRPVGEDGFQRDRSGTRGYRGIKFAPELAGQAALRGGGTKPKEESY